MARFSIRRSKGISNSKAAMTAAARERMLRACIESLEDRQYLTATFTTLYTFTGGSDGGGPRNGLVADSNGNLYGTTQSSGQGCGGATIFEYDVASNSLSTLATFPTEVYSEGPLTIDASGDLFGTTYDGGSGDGSVFELAHGSNTITTLASFDGSNGAEPSGALALDSSGNLYGTTYAGGQDDYGTVFELPAGSSTISDLVTFDQSNGEGPYGGIYRNTAGDLFGTTEGDGYDGTYPYGTVFEILPGNSSPVLLHAFDSIDGSEPAVPLVADSSGDLYGTASEEGSGGDGNVFELANDGGTFNFSVIGQSNDNSGDGEFSAVAVDSAGDVFTTSPVGGNVTEGAVAEFPAGGSGAPTDIYSFNAQSTGMDQGPTGPEGGVLADSAGDFYGVTESGGTSGEGVLYELTNTGYVTTTTITVTPPSAQYSAADVAHTFNLGSFSETNATGPYQVTVDWNDSQQTLDTSTFTMNSPGTITPQSHTFPATGTYDVYETVADSANNTSSQYEFTVTVGSITTTAASHQSATAGSSQSFQLGSFEPTDTTAPYTIDVNWGDGSSDTTFTTSTSGGITAQSHTYAAAGSNTVSVTVTDANGVASGAATFTATVAPAPASITITPPSAQYVTAETLQSINLGSFSAANASPPYIVDINWNDQSSSTVFSMNSTGTITPQTHSFSGPGTYQVQESITDSANNSSSEYEFMVTAGSIDVTPAANQSATAGTAQTFNLGSFAAADTTGPYSVDVAWGDGSSNTVFSMSAVGTITPQSHTYGAEGSDTVSVTVTDANGVVSNAGTFTATVAAAPSITVAAASNQNATVGQSQSFDLGSFTETNATAPYTVDVNWGDGSSDTMFTMNAPGAITAQAHTYTADGTDTVSVTVTDSASHSSNTATFYATVSSAPAITVTPASNQSATADASSTFDLGSFSQTNTTGPYTVDVNWGDSSPDTTFTMSAAGTITPQAHTYDSAASDTVTVTVTDANDVASNAATFTATVAAAPSITVAPAANQSATAGVSQSFDLGSFTETNASGQYSVDVSWGDGSSDTVFTMNAAGTITPQSHTYSAAGSDTVSVTITNSDLVTSNTATFTATVAPAVGITVSPGPNQSATVGTATTFNLGTFAESNATAPYTVSVDWGDGSNPTIFTMNAAGTITPQSHTYSATGSDTVSVSVLDSDDNASNTATFTATVITAPSVTVAPPSSQSATTGQSTTFNLGSFTESNATGPYSVSVNWGDGSANTTFSMSAPGTITAKSHTYSSAASDTVTVTVSDANGVTSNAGGFTATVTNPATSLVVTGASNQSATAQSGKTFSLGSFTQSNGTAPYTVSVNWGDGSANTTFSMSAAGTITSQAHTYAAAGTDTVSVTVTDSASHTSNTATYSVSVAAAPVTTITVAPASNQSATATVGESFNLGSFSETNGTVPYTVDVSWGDGSADTTFSMAAAGTIAAHSHTYAAAGSDTVSVSITDSAGHTSNAGTFTAAVASAPSLTVTAAPNQSGPTGQSHSFNLGSFSESNATGPYTVSVNWGDGSSATTFTASGSGTLAPQAHTYAASGAETIAVTVADANGVTSNTGSFIATLVTPSITVTAASNQAATAGVAQSFNLGSFSESNATAPYTVSVNWGDGSANTSFTMNAAGTLTAQSHTYAAAGSDMISVQVTDSESHVSNAGTLTATVGPAPSIAVTAPAPQAATAGVAASVALGSFAESSATGPYSVSVDWGDGTANTSFPATAAGTIAPQTHTFADAGGDTVSVTVTDANGTNSNTATFGVAVAPSPNQTTVVVHVYDDPTQTGSTSSPQPGRVVFIDSNGDGLLEAGEPSATTDASGSATLYLPAGQSGLIGEVVPEGMAQVGPAASEVAVPSSGSTTDVNFFTKSLTATPTQTTATYSNYALPNIPSGGSETDASISQLDGKVVVAGTDRSGSTPRAFVARYLPDGEADDSFANGGLAYGPSGSVAASVVEEPDGTIYLASNGSGSNAGKAFVSGFSSAGAALSVATYSTADTSATTNPVKVAGLTLAADGSMLLSGVVGTTSSSSSPTVSFITDLAESTLQPISTFGTDGTVVGSISGASVVTPVMITSSGAMDLLIETASGPVLETYTAAGTSPGAVSLAAAVGTNFTPAVASLDAQDQLVIAGLGPSPSGGNLTLVLARVNPNGSPDTTFNQTGVFSEDESSALSSAGTLALCDMAVLGDGTILITGKYDDAAAGVYQAFCQEYSSSGTEELGYVAANGNPSNELVVNTSSANGVVSLAALSGVLPTPTTASTGEVELVMRPAALQNGSVGFTQPVMSTGSGSVADMVLEKTAPLATWQTPEPASITTNGSTGIEEVRVQYTDPIGVLRSSLATGNLQATLPDGTTELLTYLGTEQSSTNQDVYADYGLAPANGAWTEADNGQYKVSLLANQVRNSSKATAAEYLGSFTVSIHPGPNTQGTTPSTISLSLAAATVQSGTFANFTATVGSADASVTTPAGGSVSFYEGSTLLGTASVLDGVAHYATAALSAGSHAITALYNGDNTYVASAPSSAVAVSVTAPAANAAALTPSLARVKLPGAVIAGQKHPISIPLTITNVGQAIERGTITVNLYFSTTSTLDSNAVAAAKAVRPTVRFNPGAGHTYKLGVSGLPASLAAGNYYLLAQVIDPAGFAQETASATTVTVAAATTSPSLSIRQLPVSLASGALARGPLVLMLADAGNVAINSIASITVYATASGAIDSNSIKILTAKTHATVAVGKAKGISLKLGKLPSLAAGSYRLAATIDVAASNGAPAAGSSVLASSTFVVA